LVRVVVLVELLQIVVKMVVMVETQECLDQTLVQQYSRGVLAAEVAVADLLVLVVLLAVQVVVA
jgi:hypothetical protein